MPWGDVMGTSHSISICFSFSLVKQISQYEGISLLFHIQHPFLEAVCLCFQTTPRTLGSCLGREMPFVPLQKLNGNISIAETVLFIKSKELGDGGHGPQQGRNASLSAGVHMELGSGVRGVFHLLKCLALGTAGNISQSHGISTETSVSAARTQTATISSAVGVRKSVQTGSVLLGEDSLLSMPKQDAPFLSGMLFSYLGCSFPVQDAFQTTKQSGSDDLWGLFVKGFMRDQEKQGGHRPVHALFEP